MAGCPPASWINAAWLKTSLTAANLLAFTQTILLDGELVEAESKNCATRCYTRPPESPTDNDASTSGWPRTRPGH